MSNGVKVVGYKSMIGLAQYGFEQLEREDPVLFGLLETENSRQCGDEDRAEVDAHGFDHGIVLVHAQCQFMALGDEPNFLADERVFHREGSGTAVTLLRE